MNDRDGRSFRFLLLAGCTVLIGGLAAVTSTCVYLGIKTARTVERNERDPGLREAAALEQLGAAQLPEGFRAVVAFSVPLLTRLTILDDRSGMGGRPGATTTTLARIEAGPRPADVDLLLDPDEIFMELLRGQGYAIEVGGLLGRGSVELDDVLADYVTRRARILLPGSEPAFGGIVSAIRPRCAEGSRSPITIRFGGWPWSPTIDEVVTVDDASPETTAPEPGEPSAGTVYVPGADREGLRKLLAPLPSCPGE